MATWSYLPHTPADRQAMLAAIGVSSTQELFSDVPAALRMKRPLKLPSALSEPELAVLMNELAHPEGTSCDKVSFLGGGAYDHFIPSVVKHLTGRSEFLTAYTQYQPEIAQGYLQALWEYQSLICLLTGMEMAVTSLYDGAMALSEAAIMAAGITGRREIIISQTLHPHWRDVLGTYARDKDIDIIVAPHSGGVTDPAALTAMVTEATAAIVCQSPNFFGCIESIKATAAIAHAKGALLIAAVNPVSLGILEAPGKLDADIVVGEGQSVGLPVSFGGPYIGFLATRDQWLRRTPGRIVGQTVDHEGTRGFVLTIQAREQHIRREKATSNICSNEALCSLALAIHLSALGKEGLREVANLCLQKAHFAAEEILKIPGFSRVFASPFFLEFAVRCPKPVREIQDKLRSAGFEPGLDLGQFDAKLEGCMLIAVTEKRTRAEIEKLARLLKEAVQ